MHTRRLVAGLSRCVKSAKAAAIVCAIVPLLVIAYWCLSDPTWFVPRRFLSCTKLTYDADGQRALSADGRNRRAAALSRRRLQRPRQLNLSFPGFEASCADAAFSTEELNVVAAAAAGAEDGERHGDGDDMDGPASPPLVEITYRLCCGSGSRPKTVCRTAARSLRVPADAAAAVRASGGSAMPSADLASLDLDRTLVFVTGCSADHFAESLVLVNGIQRQFRCARLVYWDLGLRAEQAERVRSLCGVVYKRFDFAKYPPHVRTLKTYAFKPLAIMETFAEYPALWWVDASVRFRSDRVERVLQLAKERHGLVLFREPEHSVWSTTYAQMYDFVATDEEGLKRTVTATGASFVAVNTRELHSTVLRWFYACALDERCIAPVAYPEPCDVRGPGDFANCHRFDQSLLTILAANIWGFGSDDYREEQEVFRIVRSTAGSSFVRGC